GLPIKAAEFQQECNDDRMAPRQDNEDGWHFVAASGSFLSITLTFKDLGGNEVTKTGTPSDPGEFTFYSAGPNTNTYSAGPNTNTYSAGPNTNTHAYIFTPAGWELVAAEADVEGAQN